jgi:hypothetical protein
MSHPNIKSRISKRPRSGYGTVRHPPYQGEKPTYPGQLNQKYKYMKDWRDYLYGGGINQLLMRNSYSSPPKKHKKATKSDFLRRLLTGEEALDMYTNKLYMNYASTAADANMSDPSLFNQSSNFDDSKDRSMFRSNKRTVTSKQIN